MSKPDYYRLMDANFNRVCEGLRVIEDWFRFASPNPDLVSFAKSLRHRIRQQPAVFWPQLPSLQLNRRNALNDCGPAVTDQLQMLGETVRAYPGTDALITANCKRIQEGLRTLEEICRLIGQIDLSNLLEQCRYQSYELEKMCYFSGLTDVQTGPRATPELQLQEDAERDTKPDWSIYFRGLYGITMADPKRGRDHVEVGGALLSAGVRVLQYRNKTDDMHKQYEDCQLLAAACHGAGALFIVNDRLDLALASIADGIHLGQEDLPPAVVKSIVRKARQSAANQNPGKPFLIGLSTHNPQQAEAALSEDIDYIGVGPIYATRTKTDLKCPIAGLDYLNWTSQKIRLPQVVIGGIDPDNLHAVLENGARCCALISSIVLQDDITAIASQVHDSIIENNQIMNGAKSI